MLYLVKDVEEIKSWTGSGLGGFHSVDREANALTKYKIGHWRHFLPLFSYNAYAVSVLCWYGDDIRIFERFAVEKWALWYPIVRHKLCRQHLYTSALQRGENLFLFFKRYIIQTYREAKVRLPSSFTATVKGVIFYGRLNIDTIRLGELEKL